MPEKMIFLAILVLIGSFTLNRYWTLRYDSSSKRRLRDEDRAALEQLQKDMAALQEQLADVVLQVAEDKPGSLRE